MHWNGRRWASIPQPLSGSSIGAALAISGTNVWFGGDDASASLLIEHWNGKRISVVRNPGNAAVLELAGTQANSIWLLGWVGEGDAYLMHRNGRRWSVARPPDFGQNGAQAISAQSRGDVWAVGGGDISHDLVAHWHGGHWHYIGDPVFWGRSSGGEAVLDLGPRDVWTVGATAIAHFDGKQWRITPSPVIGKGTGTTAIAGFRNGPLYAAGSTSHLPGKALVLRRAHKRWVRVRIPLPHHSSVLDQLAVTRRGEVWAGGFTYTISQGNYNNSRPLIEHYVPCARNR